MAKQISEIIAGDKDVIHTLRSLIDSRAMCKMEIPRTGQSWITLPLEIRNVRDTHHLLIDRVAGFEAPLSEFPEKEVSLEFKDRAGVPCRFHTKILD
jgi:hypothetical protein